MFPLRLIVKLYLIGCLFLFTEFSLAAAPVPFSATYDARYRGLRAEATISLLQEEDGSYLAESLIRVKLFGATVSSIRERSLFDWAEDEPRPEYYEFIQSGLGKRQRMINFDWQNNIAHTTVDEAVTELTLENLTLDELSMYTRIKEALSYGEQDIYFDVIDRNQIEEYYYQFVTEETVSTQLGDFQAIKVQRIREGSERVTQLWFAPEHDMLLIKIFQRDPDGDEYEITIESAQVNGKEIILD